MRGGVILIDAVPPFDRPTHPSTLSSPCSCKRMVESDGRTVLYEEWWQDYDKIESTLSFNTRPTINTNGGRQEAGGGGSKPGKPWRYGPRIHFISLITVLQYS